MIPLRIIVTQTAVRADPSLSAKLAYDVEWVPGMRPGPFAGFADALGTDVFATGLDATACNYSITVYNATVADFETEPRALLHEGIYDRVTEACGFMVSVRADLNKLTSAAAVIMHHTAEDGDPDSVALHKAMKSDHFAALLARTQARADEHRDTMVERLDAAVLPRIGAQM